MKSFRNCSDSSLIYCKEREQEFNLYLVRYILITNHISFCNMYVISRLGRSSKMKETRSFFSYHTISIFIVIFVLSTEMAGYKSIDTLRLLTSAFIQSTKMRNTPLKLVVTSSFSVYHGLPTSKSSYRLAGWLSCVACTVTSQYI